MKSLKQKIKEVESAGFIVRPNVGPTVKHTFEVPTQLLRSFFAKAHSREMKIKDAIAEALMNWIDT